MDDSRIARRKKELQATHPAMFEHPELRSGEIWLGNHLVDAVAINISRYRDNGVASARIGSKPVIGKLAGLDGTFEFQPIFAELLEFIMAEEVKKEKHPRRESVP